MGACKGVKADGTPCGIDPRFVDETGYCAAHNPEKGSAWMSELGKRGKQAQMADDGVSESELGALDTVEDAQRWLQVVGAAVATGRLSDRRAQAAVRAVSEWVKAHESGRDAAMYAELQKKLERVKAETVTRGRELKAVR